jgi:hypothetical protein
MSGSVRGAKEQSFVPTRHFKVKDGLKGRRRRQYASRILEFEIR